MTKELLKTCMKKGFLLDREMLEMFTRIDEKKASDIIEIISSLGLKEKVITKRVFNEHLSKIQSAMVSFFSGDEVDNFFGEVLGVKSDVSFKQPLNDAGKEYDAKTSKVMLLNSPFFSQRKVSVNDFVKHFRSRYESLKNILEHTDLENLTTIRKLGSDRGTYTIIGCVLDKRITKNKNLMLTVEDLTGYSTILINQNKKELFEKAKNIMYDDVLAFEINGTKELMFCNDVIFPEAFLHQKKKSNEDGWVAFISDIHVGSSDFLEENFLKFIKWINGEEGSPHFKEMAHKTRYLFIAGDLIEGVNHYPGQEKDLSIFSCTDQYKKLEELLKLIRKDIQIIICPGDHDAVWLGDPQPIINEKWAPGLYEMDNVHLVPSPSLLEIDGGYKVLLYHGKSINPFIEEIPEIRTHYGHSSPGLVVKEMVRRRHLSPMHGFVDYIPCENDPMVIKNVPDIIHTGDQHVVDIKAMNNILLIASSCWQGTTPFMEKVGITPDPCKVPLFNLKSRELKILDFTSASIDWEESDDLYCELEQKAEVSNE